MSTRDVFGSYLLDYSGRSNLSGGYLAILQTKNTAILEGVGFREKSPKLKKNSPSRPWTDPLASPSSASGAEACGQPDSCRHAPLTTLRSRNLSGSPGAWRGGPVGSWTLELQQSSRRRPTGLRHEWPETAGGIPPIGSAQDWDDRPPMPLVGDAYRDRDPQRQEAIGPRYGGQGDGTGSRGSCSRTICDGSFRNSEGEPAYKVRIGACPRVREAAPSHRGSSQLYRSHLVQVLESPGPDLQAGHPRSNRSSAGIRGQTGQERGLAVVGIRRGAEITHLAS